MGGMDKHVQCYGRNLGRVHRGCCLHTLTMLDLLTNKEKNSNLHTLEPHHLPYW